MSNAFKSRMEHKLEEHYRFVDKVSEEVDCLHTLTLSFRDWAPNLKLENVKPILELEKQNSLFLNFKSLPS